MAQPQASSSKHRSAVGERQILYLLTKHPEELAIYSKQLDTVLGDAEPFIRAYYAALKMVKVNNPAAIAEAMGKFGLKGVTQEQLDKELYEPMKQLRTDELLPQDIIPMLIDLWSKRNSLPVAQEWIAKVESGKMAPLEAFSGMYEQAQQMFGRDDKLEVVTTDTWLDMFVKTQDARKAFLKSGRKLPTFSNAIPLLRDVFEWIEPGIISWIADTGAGKSSLCMAEAWNWAREGGYQVVYHSSEMNAQMVQRRYITMMEEATRYSELVFGKDTTSIRGSLMPFPSGGAVHIITSENASLKGILNYAKRVGKNGQAAFVVLDLFGDVRLSDFREGKNETSTEILGNALHHAEKWCSDNNSILMATFQTTIEARREVRNTGRPINLADIAGGQHIESKTSIGLGVHFPTNRKNTDVKQLHPLLRDADGKLRRISIAPRAKSPVGILQIQKARYMREVREGEYSIPDRCIVVRHDKKYLVTGVGGLSDIEKEMVLNDFYANFS